MRPDVDAIFDYTVEKPNEGDYTDSSNERYGENADEVISFNEGPSPAEW